MTDWMTIGVGFLFIAVMSAPLWMAPLTERWTRGDGPSFTGLWEDGDG